MTEHDLNTTEDEQLEIYHQLQKLPINNFKEDAILIKQCFENAGYGSGQIYTDEDGCLTLKVFTGGWSDCEEYIDALMGNTPWWTKYWYSSVTGGKFIFKER